MMMKKRQEGCCCCSPQSSDGTENEQDRSIRKQHSIFNMTLVQNSRMSCCYVCAYLYKQTYSDGRTCGKY